MTTQCRCFFGVVKKLNFLYFLTCNFFAAAQSSVNQSGNRINMDGQSGSYNFLHQVLFLTSHGAQNHNARDFLCLVLYMVLCSGLYYMEARAFLRLISFFGQRSKNPLAPNTPQFFLVWMVIGFMTLGPLLFAFTLRSPIDPVWALLILLFFGLSLIPAFRHLRKNISTLYKAGYLRRS